MTSSYNNHLNLTDSSSTYLTQMMIQSVRLYMFQPDAITGLSLRLMDDGAEFQEIPREYKLNAYRSQEWPIKVFPSFMEFADGETRPWSLLS